MTRDEYNVLFHRLELNLVAFKRLMDCDEEVLSLVNHAIKAERERLYGKDIDTLLFEEHRLGFEKGSRSEREACAKVCESEAANPSCLWEEPGCWSHAAENCAGSIRARGETK
jgi:hypothetical protein